MADDKDKKPKMGAGERRSKMYSKTKDAQPKGEKPAEKKEPEKKAEPAKVESETKDDAAPAGEKKADDGKGASKLSGAERQDMHKRHEADRGDMQKSHRDEYRSMAVRHEKEHGGNEGPLGSMLRKHEHEMGETAQRQVQAMQDMHRRHMAERHALNTKHEGAEVMPAAGAEPPANDGDNGAGRAAVAEG